MARSDHRFAFAAAALLAACVPVVDEAGRGCPCASGYVCCADVNACIPQGTKCGGGAPPSLPDAPEGDAAPALAAHDAGVDARSPCGPLPAPVVHFAFDDCDARGLYRDRASGLVGVRRGPGVHCATSPFGGALAFDGDTSGDAGPDAGSGSYVRVSDSEGAAEHACTGVCRALPVQFGAAITLSVVLNVKGLQPFAHILGQWYYKDSYMLWTEADATGQRMELSVQQAGTDAGAIHVISAPFPVDTWIHWVGIYGGGRIRLYRDGALVIDQPTGGDGPLQCTDVPLQLGQIGREGACGGDIDYAYYRGGMGDLRLYDVALTDEQVGALGCDLRRK